MRWKPAILLVAALGAVAPCVGAPPRRAPALVRAPAPVPAWADDRVFVKLTDGTTIRRAADGSLRAERSDGTRDAAIERALAEAGARDATRAATVPAQDAACARMTGLDRWFEVRLPHGSDAPSAAMRIRAAGAGVEVAEVDGTGGVAVDSPTPNDPGFSLQWGLMNSGQVVNGAAGTAGADVHARAAWHVTTGSAHTVIAVLDAGVDPHPDFAARMLPGWNVPAATVDTGDQCSSHGTHVAGIAAASGNDAAGMAGMDWNARILPVTVLSGCSGYTSWLADGLVWAADHGATVINVSLQFSVGTQYLRDAVAYARARGAVVVAAAGNTGASGLAWPAAWPEVVAVGALDPADGVPGFSAIGPELDVAAPGTSIWSTVANGQHDFKSGTSMAAPFVSGTIALMHAAAPILPGAQLESIVVAFCTDVGAPGFDPATGWGRIDAGLAVRTARARAGLGDLTGDGAIDGTDLALLLGDWGACGFGCRADLNDDGVIDGADLATLIGNWGGAD